MRNFEIVMKWPLIYRLWMRTHGEKKLAPIMALNDVARVHRVLDVGCGPGTNAPHFSHADYLGIDLNARYIRNARKRYRGNFQLGDVTKLQVAAYERFDFILVNSLLHHLDISATRRVLSHLSPLLTEDGYVHVIELVLPATFSLPFVLARADRGNYPRSINEWRLIFNEYLHEVIFEPFDVSVFGIVFWNLVYFKGRSLS
jgi:SAM-dependent methyltransferase